MTTNLQKFKKFFEQDILGHIKNDITRFFPNKPLSHQDESVCKISALIHTLFVCELKKNFIIVVYYSNE